MADSSVFERSCELLALHTSLERIEVRGTVRIALRGAGLDVASVDSSQMCVVLDRLMPRELEKSSRSLHSRCPIAPRSWKVWVNQPVYRGESTTPSITTNGRQRSVLSMPHP